MYRICPIISLLDDYSMCCHLEYDTHEENLIQLNFYMALVVVGLLSLIYAIIAIIFWKCPPASFRSVDEMLTQLPSNHVKALKQMVLETERIRDKV